jgi:antitoxin (DNA-binding transcriptional repressor) of toxin-antitoxin stability system
MTMQTVTSGAVQTRFGAIADIAKSGSPVTITQYGRPTLMLFSYKEGAELLRLRQAAEQDSWNQERMRHITPEAAAITDEQINDLVNELRP